MHAVVAGAMTWLQSGLLQEICESIVQVLLSLQSTPVALVPLHLPAVHTSSEVQGSPSSQSVPLPTGVLTQTPAAHASAVHCSLSSHLICVPAWHWPLA